jgi:hypothetical protein
MFLGNLLPPFSGEVKARISSEELIPIYNNMVSHPRRP